MKKVVATNQYWTFETVLAAVEKLQPCTGISDTTYSTSRRGRLTLRLSDAAER